MTLSEGQWQLDNSPVFGLGSPYRVLLPEVGEVDIETQDAAMPRADGRRFGRDRAAGRTLTFDLLVSDATAVRDTCDALAACWQRAEVRQTPGATSVLRYCVGGRTRRVYGRGRKFVAIQEYVHQGVMPVTATFVTADPYFYADEPTQTTVTLIPPDSQAGVTVPFTVPFSLVGPSTSQGDITVGGTVPAPITLRIHGPVSDPTVTFLGQWHITLRGSLAADDWVEVDPFHRTVLTRFGKNWAGKFTAESQHLPDMKLTPGAATVVLRGTDPTGTASLDVLWRDTYASF